MLIGVFHPHDPFAAMPEGRVQALVEESVRQNVQLVFFNETGIDLDRRTIEAGFFAGESLERGVFPFPQAIMNVRPWGPRRRSDRELIFRKMVPFTAFLIDDKWAITKMVSAVPSLAPHIVPTAILNGADQIDELLRSHDKLVIKPAQGSRGAGVQALIRRNGRYGVQQGAEWIWMDRRELSEFVRELKRDYLLQPYIVCLTPDGEPYDFRILVQRNGEGRWVVSLIYPRIGGKDTITSNVSVGGRTEPLADFLTRLFPGDSRFLGQRLAELGLAIAELIDSHYAYPLNELGIDIAIDAQRRIWFYEANTCPGTLFYEKERAVQAIAYMKYIAGQAPAEQEPGSADTTAAVTIGLLLASPPSLRDLDAFADVAAAYGARLVYFQLEDISFRGATISGFLRQGRVWAAGTFPFPDVTYGLFDMTEVDASHELYRPSSNLLLTSREPKGPIPSPLFFAVAARHMPLAEHLPHYVRPAKPDAAKHFVDAHLYVVMKSDNAGQTEDILTIRRLPSRYAVQERTRLHSFDEAEFLAFLALFDDSNYILIQQIDSKTHDGHALHIRAYVSRLPDGTWEIARIAPLLALAGSEPRDSLPFEADWDWLLDREFDEETAEEMDGQLRDLACLMARKLQTANRNRLHELILDFALDANRRLLLLGGDIEGPGGAVHPYDTAGRGIPFALSLLQSRYERAVRGG